MSIESHAADAARKRTDPERYTDLADDLAGLGDVYSVHRHADRLPPRLEVVLDAANVTPTVADRLDEYNAEVIPDSIEMTGRGTLRFEVRTPALFKPAGSRDMRRYGKHSTGWTFTHDALDYSGFDDETAVDAYAREGAVLLVRRGD